MLGVTLRSEPGRKGATGSRSKTLGGGRGQLGEEEAHLEREGHEMGEEGRCRAAQPLGLNRTECQGCASPSAFPMQLRSCWKDSAVT